MVVEANLLKEANFLFDALELTKTDHRSEDNLKFSQLLGQLDMDVSDVYRELDVLLGCHEKVSDLREKIGNALHARS